jgi:glycosyltransferase involved in cell wall biosynthesis
MKVAHILYSGLGGHGAVLFSLIEGGFLPDTEHCVIFVGIEEPRQEYIDRCNSMNIPWIYVNRRAMLGYFEYIIRLFRCLLSLNAELVFAHGLAAVPSLVLYRGVSRRKLFIVMRETQAHHLKRKADWCLLALAHLFFDHVIYLTIESKEMAEKKLEMFCGHCDLSVVGNGLDTSFFSPYRREKVLGAIEIGMQSRLQTNKDHYTLLEAFALLCEMRPDLQFRLRIAGDGNTRTALEEHAKKIGFQANIVFHGMLGQTALKEFLNDLTVYVHSTHGETMSTAIMQALSMGLPVIASDVWGVSNMIDGDNGLLFKFGDRDDLARQLISVINDTNLAAKLSSNARLYATQRLSIVSVVEKYNRIFEERN